MRADWAKSYMLAALAIIFVLSGCAVDPQPSVTSGLHVEEGDGGYAVREGDTPVLFFRLQPKSMDGKYERSNYVHPLYGLDGEVLTEDFPEDHPHHRGVFWTWHQVLIGDVRAGDPWLARRFSWQVESAQSLPGGNGLRLVHRWFSPDFEGGAEPILEETAEVVVRPVTGDTRFVDFDIRLVALQEGVRLGGSEDDKGYGGFSLRVKMLEDLRFTASRGPVQPDRLASDLGGWVDFSADFGGKGTLSGVAILVHPTSTGYPQRWILRGPTTPSMQNPVWPGPEPVAVPMGNEIRLRYRLVVHRGDATNLDLASIAGDFAAMP